MFIRDQSTVSFDLPSARGEDVSTYLTGRQHVTAIVVEVALKRKAFGRPIVLFPRGNSGRAANHGPETIDLTFGQQLPA
ncbi:hypothetical protein XI03_20505 [Bradyrhizobium sp. CCBAU 65884]|uniref:hypothetical protein n=1 Tax=Bradyrhizobium sp. CCBAU 65884 TaxID=722477 RepID=UPI0023064F58|nr:hypothetical protein [Bradyrhizobium sp. CCBAU 65884]MDA9476834.1 hypothetical protein [Bradyrhizobium sp. CCBAU 65884]